MSKCALCNGDISDYEDDMILCMWCEEGALPYEHTHVSRFDGSPAMLVSQNPFILMNEEGYAWRDPESDWLPIDANPNEPFETFFAGLSDD